MGTFIAIIIGILALVFFAYSAIAVKHILMYKDINPRVIKLSWIYIAITGGIALSLVYVLTTIDWANL